MACEPMHAAFPQARPLRWRAPFDAVWSSTASSPMRCRDVWVPRLCGDGGLRAGSRDDMDVRDSTVDVFPHSATRRPFPGARRSLLILQHRPAPQSQSMNGYCNAAALPTKSSAVPQHAPGLPSSEAVATSIPPPANAKPSTHPPTATREGRHLDASCTSTPTRRFGQ
ncbi:F-box domain-containing protein [Mycena chlorophos]|uniref:F-box domain-containing protein n=1 Tax=Mycena chlorophos TaxID=658473 RepID=A0A8H6TKW0_MYCCL|nr:F-box domain-containing protein [Mycena chlorophos]